MPRVAEHLVGRAAEVRALDRALDGLESGAPMTILLLVEAHVRSLFRKLDASSRVEVARTVERATSGGSR